jgi:hypothetical protein
VDHFGGGDEEFDEVQPMVASSWLQALLAGPAGPVVADVRLEDVGDAHAGLLGGGDHAVDVTLGVDDDRDLAVVDAVAAVPQGRGVDGDDRGGHQGGPSGVTAR